MKKIWTVYPVLFLAVLLLVACIPVHSSPEISPDSSQVELVGHVLPNGDLAVLYYSAPTGDKIIHSSSVVPVNQITLDLYSLHVQNISIQLTQYSGSRIQNETIRINNNTTISRPEQVDISPQYSNETIHTQRREVQQFSVNIPSSKSEKNVSISIDNYTFSFIHKTSPDIIPVQLLGLGQLGIEIGYLTMGVVIFFLGTLTADLLLKRMKYWPPFGKAMWFVILMILGISLGMLVMSDYFGIAYIRWYYWLFPFYMFSTLAMLDIWPQKFEKWNIVQIEPGSRETTGDFDTIYVFPRSIGSQIEFLEKERIKALSRLFGKHIYIAFDRGDKDPWHLKIAGTDERIYFMVEWPEFEYEEKPYKIFRKERVWKIRRTYHIPIHGDYMKEVLEMVLKLKSVISISKENQDMKDELLDLKVYIQNGTIRANTDKVDEITSKILDKKFMPKSRITDDDVARIEKKEKEGESNGNEE